MIIVFHVLGVVGFISVVLFAMNWAYDRGVKHTEERWHNAVSRP